MLRQKLIPSLLKNIDCPESCAGHKQDNSAVSIGHTNVVVRLGSWEICEASVDCQRSRADN